MKIIEINIDGAKRYSRIKSINDNGFCKLADRAVKFLLAQTADGKFYQGTTESELFALENGDIVKYWFYQEDSFPTELANMFGFEKKKTGTLELSVINVME